MDLVKKVRNIRGEMRIDPGIRIRLICLIERQEEKDILTSHLDQVKALIRAEEVVFDQKLPVKEIGARGFSENMEFFIPLDGILDAEKEKERNLKELRAYEKEIEQVERKLGNEQFIKKAPPEVVEKNTAIRKELKEKIEGIRRILSILENK